MPRKNSSRRVPVRAPVDDTDSDTSSALDSGESEGGASFESDVLNGVVKIFVVSTEPNFSQPWSMHSQDKCTGTGFIVSGRRIITNAHVVSYHTAVRVRKHGNSEKFVAKVLAIAHDSDLAILTVEDEAFWEGAAELEIGEMPQLRQQVVVVGYPMGGDTICVTVGVVSRIDYDQYSHSTRENLVAQVDAAINPGNSGGPALSEGKVVGVAFQGMSDADNIGYIIPEPVLRHVLDDYARNGRITGMASLPFSWQTMENRYMKQFYNLPRGLSGVRVSSVVSLSKAHESLHENDIVTEIDGYDVAEDGTIVKH